MPDRPTIPKILSELGITKSLQRIKFRGVVGKQSLLGVSAVVVLGVMAVKADAKDVVVIACLAVGVVALIATLNFY